MRSQGGHNVNLRHWQVNIKYALDRIFAILLFIILLPLWLLIILLIKIDDGGPVFFTQKRVGLKGSLFTIYKFRTMIVDADRFLDEKGRVTIQNRITRVGRFLRQFGIDELPQILNIIKGEMSFVGPRPVLPSHIHRYTPLQKRRFLMKPGITGLAQVNGRNRLKWSKRLELDLWYVDNYSLLLDAKILVKTIKVVFFREGVSLDRNPEEADDLPFNPDVPHKEQTREAN